MPAEKMAQFNWKQQVPIMKGDSLIGMKVLPLQQPANQLTYLIAHTNHGGFTHVVLHTIQYSIRNGIREPQGITSYNYTQQQQANWTSTYHKTSSDHATLPTKIKQLSLVSPSGGNLPMITIVATFDDGEIIPITPTTYVHVNGAFVASNGGASNSAFNYQNLDCLDPMAPPPNPGIGGTPTEINTEDFDVIDGVLYSRYNYPGINDGYPFRWWKDDVWLDDSNNFNLDLDQDQNGQYGRFTAAEKALVREYPTHAYIISKNIPIAEQETIAIFGQNGLNDKSDAFRHAFFNAMNRRDLCLDPMTLENIAKLFSDAHESNVPPQLQKEKEMDLWNNSIGHQAGDVTFPIFTTDSQLSNDVFNRLLFGDLKYLNPIWPPMFNKNGQILNPSGDPNFHGTSGSGNPNTATHGITTATMLTPTNQ